VCSRDLSVEEEKNRRGGISELKREGVEWKEKEELRTYEEKKREEKKKGKDGEGNGMMQVFNPVVMKEGGGRI